MSSIYSFFRFYSSAEVALELKVFVSSLDLRYWRRTLDLGGVEGEVAPTDVVVRVHLLNQGVEHADLGQCTQELPTLLGNSVQWDGWITLPLRIKDLNRDAEVVFTLWGPDDVFLGSCRLAVFDSELRLRRGKQRLVVWPRVRKEGGALLSSADASEEFLQGLHGMRTLLSTNDGDTQTLLDTLGSTGDDALSGNPPFCDGVREVWRLIKAKEEYEAGEIPHMPWLDRLTMRQLSTDHSAAEDAAERVASAFERAAEGEEVDSKELQGVGVLPQCCFLTIEFPQFPFPVVFDSTEYSEVATAPVVTDTLTGPAALEEDPVAAFWMSHSVPVFDPEAALEHPVEAKHDKLRKSDVRRAADPTAKPTPSERALIDAVLNSHIPGKVISNLLWRYRYALLKESSKAVIKFAECVDWMDPDEVADAMSTSWVLAPPEDALRLLGPSFAHPFVRQYAIRCLGRASSAELAQFMLQLVQAIRYEPGVLERATDLTAGRIVAASATEDLVGIEVEDDESRKLSPLGDFLIQRACESLLIATYFHWYVRVETEDEAFGVVYNTLYAQFLEALRPTGRADTLTEILLQSQFIDGVLGAVRDAVSLPGLRADGKTERLKANLGPDGKFSDQAELRAPVVLPLDPRVRVCGIVADRCKVFRSSVSPALIPLVIHDSTDPSYIAERFGEAAAEEYRRIQSRKASYRSDDHAEAVQIFDEHALLNAPGATRWTYDSLFKIGDDVRQDQLVLQLLGLIDQRLKRFSLDLCLTPYKVLATSTTTGILEFVTGSTPIDPIKRDLLGWFAAQPGNADPSSPWKVRASVMERYTRSCAGYCVWTYVMGIGDRHLDNILVTPDGRLVHIDFGYAFGK
jgi:phosphatidylinositol 3-kinase